MIKIFLLLTLLTSCGWKSVPEDVKQIGECYCGKQGGLKSISSEIWPIGYTAHCFGSTFAGIGSYIVMSGDYCKPLQEKQL